jgi:hypothetical protein
MDRSVKDIHQKLLAGLNLQFIAKWLGDNDLEFWRDFHFYFLHDTRPLTHCVDAGGVCQDPHRSAYRNTNEASIRIGGLYQNDSQVEVTGRMKVTFCITF